MDKKAQAAMEFLMTYGWAILAAIIAIGVLAYFGVFSPGRFVQDTATLTAPLGIESQVINAGNISLEIRNGAGESILVNSVAISGCGTYSTTTQMNVSQALIFPITCSPALTTGNSFRGDISVNYRRSTAGQDARSTGTITGKVQ